MAQNTVRLAIADYIRNQALPPDKYSHQPRLYALACQIAAGQHYDDDVLYAAAWLHDIGVFLGHRPADPQELARWDNVAYAVRVVPQLLAAWDFPGDKVEPVVAAIASHLPNQQPTTFEGTVLRDADILEQLGAVGILRIVSKVGRDTRYQTFSDAIAQLQRNLETLPGCLLTARGQELAAPRIQILRDFLDAARHEANSAPL